MLKNIKKGVALLSMVFMAAGCTNTQQNQPYEDLSEGKGVTEEDDGVITVTLAEIHVADHPITKTLVGFANEVEEKTQGRINVDVRPAERYGTENTVVSKVYGGVVDIARVSSVTLSRYSSNITPITLPYIFESKEHMWRFIYSPYGQELFDGIDGCEPLAWIDDGVHSICSDTPINTVEDLANKRFRISNSPSVRLLLQEYGASPITMDYSKIFENIEKGNINGAETDIVSYKYYANNVVAKYFIDCRLSYAPSVLIASNTLEEKVGQEDYKIILECAENAWEKSKQLRSESEEAVKKELADSGTQIITPSEEVISQLKATAENIYSEYPEYKDVIDSIKSCK